MPDRAFTLKPMERSLPRRDWRWTRSQSILIAMEVFSWRSGPVGFGRTEDIPFQRSKASSGDMSESCPDYPGQIRSNPLSANLYPGHPRFRLPFYRSKGQQQEDDHRARFVCSIQSAICVLDPERYLCARSRARFVCSIQSAICVLDPERDLCALAISTRQHPALLFSDTQKLFGCLGLDGVNQVKLGPLRSSSAVNTRVV